MTQRVLLLALTLNLGGLVSSGFAEQFYVSQNGTGNGSSCSNSRSLSWLNSSANWSNPKQASRIGPGDTVFLCGAFSSGLTLRGSGAAAAHVTIDGQNATLGTSVQFNTNNQSWWRIQNVTWTNGASFLLRVVGGSNGIFTGCRADNTFGFGFVTGSANNITISNCFVRSTTANLGSSQYDMISADSGSNITIEGNHIELRIDGEGGSAHNDVIQSWGSPSNWTIRHNWIALTCTAPHDRSWLMLESLSGTVSIYGNVFFGTNGCGVAGNGISSSLNKSGVVFNIYQNTFVSRDSPNNILNLRSPGTANIRGNIFHIGGATAVTGNMTQNRSHNIWFGSNIPSCSGVANELCGVDPLFVNYTGSNFSLMPSSLAISSSGDFGAPYQLGVAAGSTWPGPTLVPRGTAWDRGAYQASEGSPGPPAAPTNVRIVR